jgi:hypothetical protein
VNFQQDSEQPFSFFKTAGFNATMTEATALIIAATMVSMKPPQKEASSVRS